MRFFTMATSGSKRRALSGPFTYPEQAQGDLDRVRRLAREKFSTDIEASFAGFGIASVEHDRPVSVLFPLPEEE